MPNAQCQSRGAEAFCIAGKAAGLAAGRRAPYPTPALLWLLAIAPRLPLLLAQWWQLRGYCCCWRYPTKHFSKRKSATGQAGVSSRTVQGRQAASFHRPLPTPPDPQIVSAPEAAAAAADFKATFNKAELEGGQDSQKCP
jgi:hypothetical protein